MGTTPTYAWPYPELSNAPDGATQIKSLATAIETTMNARVGNSPNPLPFAICAVAGAISMGNTVVQVLAMTFPVGRFTVMPVAIVSAIHGTNVYAPILSALSTTSITAGARHIDGVASSGNVSVHALAAQMTGAASPGRLSAPLDNAVARCRSAGCDNADHPIPIYLPDDSTAALCGVCGQTITDIAQGLTSLRS